MEYADVVLEEKPASDIFADAIITLNRLPSNIQPSNILPYPSYFQKHKEYGDRFIYCYENEIPAIIEAELERLYGTVFSSLKKLGLSSGASDASTYIAEKDGRIESIFLFKKTGSQIQVLNQVMSLHEEDVQCFASYMFKTYGHVHAVSFTAVHAAVKKIGLPFQQFNHSENIVVSLPLTSKEYWSSLGKSTRHNLNYYRNKLNRDFAPFSFTVYENESITPAQIRAVTELSRARITGKGKAFGKDEQEIEEMIQLAKVSGMVGVITIDGKICAGSICYRAGNAYCLEVIAHDPAFNDYRLGTLCCYLTISECIERGAKEFHFLWGEYDYKYRFLGKQRELNNIVVYRSRRHMAYAWKLASRMICRGTIRQAKLWKNDPERKKSLIETRLLEGLAWIGKAKAKPEHQPADSRY